MWNYRNLLLCSSALLVVILTKGDAMEIIRQDLNDLEYIYYEVVPNMQEKVGISVYYESLCPGCIQFHTGPLAKVMQKLGNHLNYQSYPFGKAKMVNENGKVVIECQHGSDECYGNKLHACAILILNNATRSEEYNSCMMSRCWGGKGSTDMDAINVTAGSDGQHCTMAFRGQFFSDAFDCGERLKVRAQPIIHCASSQKGENLAQYYGNETAKVHFKYVPYVLVNGKQFTGEDNAFMSYVCAAFTNPPIECTQ